MELFSLQPYAGKRVCVALSGGADSVCLLHYFWANAARFSISLSALTCEHGIRGAASLSDLAFVKDLCAAWQIPLAVFSEDVPAFAAREGMGLEEAGRAFRYRCFAQMLNGRCDCVATAHHRDDEIETVLFRLMRGTSPAGLNVFPPREGIVRPLRARTRAEIMRYLTEHGLSYVTDESNADERYTRNYIRHTLLPAMERAVHGAGEHLLSFAQLAAEDEAYLHTLAAQAVRGQEGGFAIAVALPPPILRRAIVIALRALGISDYTGENIGAVMALTGLQRGRKACLPRGVLCVREGDDLILYRPSAPFAGEIPFAPGVHRVGRYLLTIAAEGEPLAFDLDRIPQGCVIRCRRQGDLFQPFGGGHKTLKKFLNDRHIPARRGAELPLLACGNRVLAVAGVEIAEELRITAQTIRRASLALDPLPTEENQREEIDK